MNNDVRNDACSDVCAVFNEYSDISRCKTATLVASRRSLTVWLERLRERASLQKQVGDDEDHRMDRPVSIRDDDKHWKI